MNMFEYLSRFVQVFMARFRGSSGSWSRGTIRRKYPKRGRNEQCWCRAGRKYKRCHWREDYLAGRV